jgi:hypothetical protein
MTMSVEREDAARFYKAAMGVLGVLDARRGRAFGADADARWQSFRGALQDWDRIEILVRDAAMAYGSEQTSGAPRIPCSGFAPRIVFDLPALADDEPSGPDWIGPEPTEALDLLRLAKQPRDPMESLEHAAAAWGATSAKPPTIGEVLPSTQLLICGAGAILGVAGAFLHGTGLDLPDQVVLVSDEPATRQLFGLAVALQFQGSRRPVRMIPSTISAEEARRIHPGRIDRAIVSADVTAEVRARAEALARELGAR